MLLLAGLLGVALLASAFMVGSEESGDTTSDGSETDSDTGDEARDGVATSDAQGHGGDGDLLQSAYTLSNTETLSNPDGSDTALQHQTSSDVADDDQEDGARGLTYSSLPPPPPMGGSSGGLYGDTSVIGLNSGGGSDPGASDPDDATITRLVETLVGSSDGDLMSGGAGADHMSLQDGDNIATGGAGADTIEGGNGHDTIEGGLGADSLSGDDGADVLTGWAGNDTLVGGAGSDVLRGHIGDDLSLGGTGDDRLEDGAGDDTLEGGAGNDMVLGGEGHDELHGGADSDTLFGDDGDDTLVGSGDGATDYLNGGHGDDFIFAGTGDVVHTGHGADRVILEAGAEVDLVNFTSGEDVLELRGDVDPGTSDVILNYDAARDVTLILVDGTPAATLRGAPDIDVQDITLSRM